jgi:hypothetical protein
MQIPLLVCGRLATREAPVHSQVFSKNAKKNLEKFYVLPACLGVEVMSMTSAKLGLNAVARNKKLNQRAKKVLIKKFLGGVLRGKDCIIRAG